MSPSCNSVPGSGKRAAIPGLVFSTEEAKDSCCGEPKRPVPRVTMSAEITRSSAGTKIGAAAGGAVLDATSAGELICEPTTQPIRPAATTTPIAMPAIRPRPVIARRPLSYIG